jgi:hypothetical protein
MTKMELGLISHENRCAFVYPRLIVTMITTRRMERICRSGVNKSEQSQIPVIPVIPVLRGVETKAKEEVGRIYLKVAVEPADTS